MKAVLTILLLLCSTPVHSETKDKSGFDWDKYHDQQFACQEYQKAISRTCSDTEHCDQSVIDYLQRQCSVFNRK